MKFNLDTQIEAQKAFSYLTDLSSKHALIEVKKISPKRSLNQNSYLHLIIAAFGAHFGYTASEAKIVYKEVSADIYKYIKKDTIFLRSSADLTKEEMAKTIDRFMEASKAQGYPLPLATDQEWLRQIENEIERSGHYL